MRPYNYHPPLQKKEYNEVLVMSKLVRHFANFNKDYSDFLSLKGEVNIPMVRYPCQGSLVA